MKGFTSRNHGIDVFWHDPGVKQDRSVIVVPHKLVHLGWQVLNRVTSDCVYAHRVGKRNEIRVDHLGV